MNQSPISWRVYKCMNEIILPFKKQAEKEDQEPELKITRQKEQQRRVLYRRPAFDRAEPARRATVGLIDRLGGVEVVLDADGPEPIIIKHVQSSILGTGHLLHLFRVTERPPSPVRLQARRIPRPTLAYRRKPKPRSGRARPTRREWQGRERGERGRRQGHVRRTRRRVYGRDGSWKRSKDESGRGLLAMMATIRQTIN